MKPLFDATDAEILRAFKNDVNNICTSKFHFAITQNIPPVSEFYKMYLHSPMKVGFHTLYVTIFSE
jgi:hypothetical protein